MKAKTKIGDVQKKVGDTVVGKTVEVLSASYIEEQRRDKFNNSDVKRTVRIAEARETKTE